jgi:protein SCO1/2
MIVTFSLPIGDLRLISTRTCDPSRRCSHREPRFVDEDVLVHTRRPSGPFRAVAAAVVLGALWLVGLAGCGADEQSASGPTPTALRGLTRETPLQVGSVALPDQTVGGPGGELTFRAAPGELLVAYFGYTSCPDVCPTTLADLRAARELLGEDARRIDLAMVTVDPERDTPEVLTAYLGSFAERFHALRPADQADLEDAERAFGASSRVDKLPDGTVEVAHSATTYVIDQDGTVLVEWPFGTAAQDMAHDLRLLLARVKG